MRASTTTTRIPLNGHPAVIRAALRSLHLRRDINGPQLGYTYDANGNTANQTDAGNASTGSAQARSYVWDTDNRLIEVHDANNAIVATYIRCRQSRITSACITPRLAER